MTRRARLLVTALCMSTALAITVPAVAQSDPAQTDPAVTAWLVQHQGDHTFLAPLTSALAYNDPAFFASTHQRADLGRARLAERLAQYKAAHPANVPHRVGVDHHAERNARQYNKLMAQCQTGNRFACADAPAFLPR